ncbi:tellurite resistance TerB family protein [Mesorhizobium sp.]|uniref:tellurite resistance TerB family protein n=1 Tax=Mesorhizobium sp. TaxID=1871066 RepID=UPI000FE5E099|nr:tellurite resistance TerB family protein [Mesorhizobium sp.]RWM67499.1 MAG: tellurite resistance TerB family protein [Mesorhizobium sp.]TIO21973.1 MAG: tellurite resistance TerB family protein [Mesorhizobium sp.]TJV56929.1 MAG: tellurite resistance TerB family protein [Mesorhizobium sp.]
MFDPKKLLDDLLGSQIPGTGSTVRDKGGQAVQMAKDNPLATGALAAVLLGTGAGRQVTGTAVKLGGLAMIGGLAYKAYQNYKNGKAPAETAAAGSPELLPPPADTSFHPSQAPQGEDEFTLMLVRAMISAAKADGHIDDDERQKIAGKLSLSGIGSDAEKFLMSELETPLDLDTLVARAQTDAQKLELYTASRLTIDPDTRSERGYLDLLAGRLGLPDALVDHVEATVSAAKVPAAKVPESGVPESGAPESGAPESDKATASSRW